MDYALVILEEDSLNHAEDMGPEKLSFGDSLEEAHERVRRMWPFPNVDTSEKSRLAWRKGEKVIVYTYAGRDVIMVLPSVLVA